MMWETDPESEETRASGSPASALGEQTPFGFFSDSLHGDDCVAPLEMPDGSLRMSSNWLPVDTTAGFTIGSQATSAGFEYEDHMHIDALGDMRAAFISTDSASGKLDR